MNQLLRRLLPLTAVLVFFSSNGMAHCEIPCGIYDDAMRITLISEHITTIEKSMTSIMDLEKGSALLANQQIRWVMNKEDHADKLQDIITTYFMTQRLKVTDSDYAQKLTLLHQILVAAMKSKQTTDLKYVSELRDLLAKFEKLYFQAH